MGVAGVSPQTGKRVDGSDNSKVSILFGRKQGGRIGKVDLDVVVSEEHTYSNQVTSFPVEDGSDITDHVRQEPEMISLSGIVTGSPVEFFGGVRKASDFFKRGKGAGNDQLKEAFEGFLKDMGYNYPEQAGGGLKARNTASLVDISLGLRNYTNMIITNFSVPRDKGTGEALRFSLTAKRVRLVALPFEVNTVSAEKLSGGVAGNKQSSSNTVDKGDSGMEEPKPSANRESVLRRDIRRDVEYIKSLFGN